MNIETPPDDGWGNSSNWEYKQPQKVNATLPFRPNRNTNFLSDAHYFQLKNQARKKIIDDDLPNLRTPSQTVSNDSNLQELKDRQGWNDVFVASYNLARKNKSVSDAWTKPIERSAKKPLQLSEALLYRTRKITNPEGEFSQDAKFTGNVFEYTPKPPTTPEALCALYLKRRMKRDTIRNSISKPQGPEQKAREMELEKTRKKKEKEAKSGRSASQWIFENLIDLSCVPLFGVDLAAIIPYRFEELEKEVIERIKERYIVRRILDELTVATFEELSQFSSTHMSWFLLNPWCLFFTALRDLLSRGQAELNYDHKKEGREETSQEDRDTMAEYGLSRLDETTVNEEEQEETTSEQLLHRFMEVILLLFSIICDSRDEYRSTPGKVKRNMYVGGLLCDIEDDGYVYISRAGTSGHGPADDNREGRAPYVKWVKRGPKESKTEVQSAAGGEEEIPFEKPTEKKDDAIYMEVPLDEERSHVSSDRSRFGTVPIIRYETKRLNTAKSRDLNVFSQIFSQLLTAAEMNMAYLEDVDTLQGNWLTAALDKPSVSETTAKYHDAFVIHVIHHTLTIHTARFPKSYLDWIKTKPEGSNDDDVAPENFAILYKVSAEYDLSVPQKRLQAACDILILLWAIKHGKAAVITSQNSAESNIATEEDIATEYGPLFVARAVWKKDIKMKAANKDTKSTKIGDGSTSKNFLGLEIHGQKVDVPDGTSMHPIHHTGMEMCNTLPGSFDIVNDMGHH